MFINEIPVGASVCIAQTMNGKRTTFYTEVVGNTMYGHIPSLDLPKLSNLSIQSSIIITYFDPIKKINNRWTNLDIKEFSSIYRIYTAQDSQLIDRRSSSRIPLGLPCAVTGDILHAQGAVLHNLSLEGFNLALGDQVVNVNAKLTIKFEDDDYSNVINGTVVHVETDNDGCIHCGGIITDSLNPLDDYLNKKGEDYFNKQISAIRSRK